jgi:anti-sigma B factor antagonist
VYAVIESSVRGGAVCRLSGALELASAAQLRAAMAACTAFDDLFLDLSEVRFMDSAAVGVLVAGIRRVREAGGQVTVGGARRNLRRLLQAIGFDRVAPLWEGPVPIPVRDIAEAAAV